MWILDGLTLKFFCHAVHHLIVPQHFKTEQPHTPNVTNWLHFVPVDFSHLLIISWLCQEKNVVSGSFKTQLSRTFKKYLAGSILLVLSNLSVIADQVSRNGLVKFSKWIVESGHSPPFLGECPQHQAICCKQMVPGVVCRVRLWPCPATEGPWCSSLWILIQRTKMGKPISKMGNISSYLTPFMFGI